MNGVWKEERQKVPILLSERNLTGRRNESLVWGSQENEGCVHPHLEHVVKLSYMCIT